MEDYHAVAARLDDMLTGLGVPVDATYLCPHHPEFSGPCRCRKPGVGMYEDAVRDLRLDAASSWYVGDKVTDVLPADIMGGRGMLVRTGYGLEQETRVPEGTVIVDDLPAAAAVIAP
jgi:D-glycero-D-manno-heptose 1,7-bisphosphate phosphatase